MPLACCTVETVPKGRGWSIESSGYVMVKLKRSLTPAGHSFLGRQRTVDADKDYGGTSNFGGNAPTSEALSPPRKRSRHLRSPGWLEGCSTSPGSPSSELAGCTHPLPIRWHRAAALSLSSDPVADSQLVVRHICGNKRCAKVGHFRSGSQRENSKDEEYHRTHPRCSREAFPKLEG